MKIKSIFKKVKVKETPYDLVYKNKVITFRTTEYVDNFLNERSFVEARSKASIINEILEYEAYRYNKKKEVQK